VCGVESFIEQRGKSYRINHYQGYNGNQRQYSIHKLGEDFIDALGINGNQNMGIKGFNSGSVSDNKVCLDSSAGQSDSLVSCRSRVRIPPEAPF
jgi:hypothetical protein